MAITLPVITIPPDGSVAIVSFGAKADDGSFQSLSSLSASLDDATHMFIVPTGAVAQLAVSPKGPYPAVGATWNANVTIQAASVDGTPLPSYIQPVTITGAAAPPPPAPQATTLVVSVSVTQTSIPGDPGTATITLPVS